jgi:hypothetical protein
VEERIQQAGVGSRRAAEVVLTLERSCEGKERPRGRPCRLQEEEGGVRAASLHLHIASRKGRERRVRARGKGRGHECDRGTVGSRI